MPSTQFHLDIYDIQNDLVVLKDGSACLILEVSAINFGLFSEREQEATIYAYAQLLNSLTFPIQIVLSSRRKDITDYVERIDSYLAKTTNPKLREQITKYRAFVLSIVRQGNVLDKKFFISIPFSSLELGLARTINPFSSPIQKPVQSISTIVDRAATNLAPKRDHLVRLLARIGLRSRQLTSDEILQLFFETYNPSQLGVKVNLPNATPPTT